MAQKHTTIPAQLALRLADGAPQTVSVQSSSFQPDRPIPESYSASGDGHSPELHWSDVPSQAQSLVLLMEDPDVPQPNPFVHWVVYNVPPAVKGLPASVPRSARLEKFGGAMQGRSSAGDLGYFGPCGDLVGTYAAPER